MNLIKILIYLYFFLFSITYGQSEITTVAVLDFEARGINALEAGTLTDRFTSELNKTNTMRLVERGMMADILEEQGFQQTGCTTDECAVEVGALLGVQKMISGAIGKIGSTYTIDLKMVSVQTGATEETKSVTYMGKVDGLITEMEILAWELMKLKPPQALVLKKRMGAEAYLSQQTKQKTKIGAMTRSLLIPGYGQFYSGNKKSAFFFMGTQVAFLGLALNSQSKFNSLQSDQDAALLSYNASVTQSDIETYATEIINLDSDLQSANDQLTLFSISAASIWALNILHAYISGPDEDLASLPVYLAYNPVSRGFGLTWSITL
jgi:hypothetical protein